MEKHEQFKRSRVVKVDSVKTWDFFKTQAINQGSPVSLVHFFQFLINPCNRILFMTSYIT